MTTIETVNYDALDRAKLKFIEASKRTLSFASQYGFVPNETLGGSSNIFAFDISGFNSSHQKLYMSLVPEGLGTADEAKPEDLSEEESVIFWRNISQKVLSCLTNDAISSGLQTVLVGLYLPSSTPESVFSESFLNGFLDGFVDGCKRIGCVYLSGETPQLKSKIYPGVLDIAGSCWGVIPAGQNPITGEELGVGNYIVLLESSGPHENGFTTLRKFASTLPHGYREKLPSGAELYRSMNEGSILYTPIIQSALREKLSITALEHITGHGLQKIMRSSKNLNYYIENPLPIKEVFTFFEQKNKITRTETAKIFNCGSGFAVFLKDLSSAERMVSISKEHGVNASIAGTVRDSNEGRSVSIPSWGVELNDREFLLKKN